MYKISAIKPFFPQYYSFCWADAQAFLKSVSHNALAVLIQLISHVIFFQLDVALIFNRNSNKLSKKFFFTSYLVRKSNFGVFDARIGYLKRFLQNYRSGGQSSYGKTRKQSKFLNILWGAFHLKKKINCTVCHYTNFWKVSGKYWTWCQL